MVKMYETSTTGSSSSYPSSSSLLLIDLMKNWENCYVYLQSETKNRTMYEETELFMKKLNKLHDLIGYLNGENLKNYVDRDDVINQIEHRLRKMYEDVKNDKSLNAGGKFEWVDSLLVNVSVPLHYFILKQL